MFDGGREGCPRKEIRMRKVVVVERMTRSGSPPGPAVVAYLESR
jgi:hypothetical protein